MATTHYPQDSKYLWIQNANDNDQGGTSTATAWGKLVIAYSTSRSLPNQDVIEDDDVTTGLPVPGQHDINWQDEILNIGVWANATEAHHLYVWLTGDVPTVGVHTLPLDLYDATGNLPNSREFVYFDGKTAFGDHGILTSINPTIAKKGKILFNLTIYKLDVSVTPPSAPNRFTSAPSLWRKHVSFSGLGGNSALESAGMSASRKVHSVPPDFASSDLRASQFDWDGRWDVKLAIQQYAATHNPMSQKLTDTAEDLAGFVTFNDGSNSFSIDLGNAKYLDASDTLVRGNLGYDYSMKVIENSGVFFKVSALS